MIELFKSAGLAAARRSKTIRSAARFIYANTCQDGYAYLRERFVANGLESSIGVEARRSMVTRFEAIDDSVPIGSTPTDGLVLAELLINCEGNGDVVECGCYAGGSTAKLSIVAKALGKRLRVYDSYEGLPTVDEYDLRDFHARRSLDWATDWSAGRYATRLDEVRRNIGRFGEVDICTFVPGWFSDTLLPGSLPKEIAFAFTDVDIPSSARECLAGLWPRLTERGVYVSHDAAYVKVLQNLHDARLWEQLKSFPPIFFGAGFGVSDSSPHLGYFVKGDALSADYLKSLTLDK